MYTRIATHAAAPSGIQYTAHPATHPASHTGTHLATHPATHPATEEKYKQMMSFSALHWITRHHSASTLQHTLHDTLQHTLEHTLQHSLQHTQ